jgi:hypothetical protein
MNMISSSGNFIGMAEIRLDRLLKQRSALREPDFSFGFPPPRPPFPDRIQAGRSPAAIRLRSVPGEAGQAPSITP